MDLGLHLDQHTGGRPACPQNLTNRVRKVRKRIKNSRRYKTVQVKTAIAVLGITSLSSREAAPKHLATYVRGYWSIENRLHWVRSPGATGLLRDVARTG